MWIDRNLDYLKTPGLLNFNDFGDGKGKRFLYDDGPIIDDRDFRASTWSDLDFSMNLNDKVPYEALWNRQDKNNSLISRDQNDLAIKRKPIIINLKKNNNELHAMTRN